MAGSGELNGFGTAASGANVAKLLEMKRAHSTPIGTECPECGGAAPGHRRGCSRDPAQERPKPPPPPAPAPPAGRPKGKRVCGACGKLVGAPGLRHKYGCTEYAGAKMNITATAIEPVAVPTPEPAPVPAPAAARVAPPEVQPSYPVAPTPRLVAEPDAVPDDDADFNRPSTSALNSLRAPCLNAGVRLLSRLGDDDAKWVLDALYRISRGLRAPRP